MKIVKRVLLIIITVILVLILIFNLNNFIQIKIMKKDLATLGGYAVLEVVTGSMEPTIKVGDLIVINTKEKQYKKNDIITFYDVNNSFVTHRLKEIKDDVMITKGDNNNTEDEALPVKNIVGKYIFKISGLGIILSSLKNPFVSIMILVIGILICFLISTDKFGNPILDEDEKEFQDYLKEKESKIKEDEKPNKLKDVWNKLKSKFKKEKPKKKKQNKKKKKKKSKSKNKKKGR